MKVTSRNMVRAALVFTAAGVIGAFGACKNDNGTNPPPPPPPPPPPAIRAPIGLTATAVSATKINLAWTDSTTNETGFRVDRCSGAACTNFAQVGTNLAANTVAFTDSGLTASTSYSYRVRAFNATDSSAWTSTVSATTLAAAASAITLIGAGEITTCSSIGTSQTAALIQSQVTADPNTIVFTAGNNVADSGAGNYSTCFDPTWGKFKSNMHAALGDMDFKSTNGTAPYEYFGAAIGSSKGYYSFDAGSWHIIVLNTTAEGAGKCAWSLGPNSDLNSAAEMLYAAGLDVLVSAKDQQYERFPKLNVDGAADPKGFAQFIVGTGGRSLGAMHTPLTGNPVIAQYGNTGGPDKGYGVVQFTLHDGSYDAKFVPTTGNTFADSVSSVACN